MAHRGMSRRGLFIALLCLIVLSLACEITFSGRGGSRLRMTFDSLPAWIDGEPGSFQLTAEGGTPPYQWDITDGALPDGFALEGDRISGMGVLGGGTTQSVSPPFTLRVRDSSDPQQEASQSLVIQIVGSAPEISCLSLPDATEGQPYKEQVATAQGENGPFSFMLDSMLSGAPPMGLTIEPIGQGAQSNQGYISGTPGLGTGDRTYEFSVCVKDITGASDCCSQPMSLRVLLPSTESGASLTGVWTGPYAQTDAACDFSGTLTLDLVQTDSQVTGIITIDLALDVEKKSGFCSSTRWGEADLIGSVSGSDFTFSVPQTDFAGSATLAGNSMTGTTTATSAGVTTEGSFTLTR
jgi:hypothetical protein